MDGRGVTRGQAAADDVAIATGAKTGVTPIVAAGATPNEAPPVATPSSSRQIARLRVARRPYPARAELSSRTRSWEPNGAADPNQGLNTWYGSGITTGTPKSPTYSVDAHPW